MAQFTPVGALIGGALIGASASLLLWLNGRVAGISGIVAGLVRPQRGDLGWRVSFVAGLVVAGILLALAKPSLFGAPAARPLVIIGAAGLLVGVGTGLANGCTSGHGVCGLSRLSKRSLVATLTFMTTGALAVLFARHVLG